MKNKEFDINRGDYDKKVEEIRKKKRTLRNIQEPDLVKKIKKDLKVIQRGAKRHDKDELNKYLKDEVAKYDNDMEQENEELIFNLREMLFHHTDETAKPIIEDYLKKYPQLLKIHSVEWYLKNC